MLSAGGRHEPLEGTMAVTRMPLSDLRRREEQGAAAVEFALVAPILFMLVFGIIGFGMVFAQELSLGNGARQGARAGVVANATCKDIYDETRSGSQTINLDPSALKVLVYRGSSEPTPSQTPLCDSSDSSLDGTVPCAGSSPGDNLYVYADFDSIVTVPLVPMSHTFPLQGKGTFRCEFS